MLLTIDIGNTNLTLGLYEGQKLGARWRLATNYERMPDEYGLQILGLLQHSGCSIQQLDGICLASVSPTHYQPHRTGLPNVPGTGSSPDR